MAQIQEYINDCMNCSVCDETRATLCPVCTTQRVMQGKWKVTIIWLLKDETLRFSQLKNSIPNVTQTSLSKQLKSLEEDNLIIRKSYNQVPPKVEYFLSETGRKFIDVLEVMSDWGMEYIQEYILPEYEKIQVAKELE